MEQWVKSGREMNHAGGCFCLATFGGFVPVMEIDLFRFVWEVVS